MATLQRIENSPLATRGNAIYRDRIQPLVEPKRHGEFVIIDVDSEDYEVDPDQLTATHRLLARHPGARVWVRRVGFEFVRHLGFGFRAETQ